MRRRLGSALDLLDEAASSIARRKSRSALTALGTLLGVATFVATISLSATTAAEVASRFDLLEATSVVVFDANTSDPTRALPPDADERIAGLNGVVAGGRMWPIDTQRGVAAVSAVGPPAFENLAVVAASAGFISAAKPSWSAGGLPADDSLAMAVLGSAAAQRLGNVTVGDSVNVDGVSLVVAGVLEDVARSPDLLLSVVVSDAKAEQTWGQPADDEQALIDVDLGAAVQVAAEAPLALRPDDPDRLVAYSPPSPESLRTDVEGDLSVLILVMAGITMLIGGVGIANTTLISVFERVHEIGLRRAVGASRGGIAAQFLVEATVLGFLGGAVGAVVGTLVTVVVAAVRDVTPIVEPLGVAAAPVLGSLVGLLAGLYPSLRAAALEPLEALRR